VYGLGIFEEEIRSLVSTGKWLLGLGEVVGGFGLPSVVILRLVLSSSSIEKMRLVRQVAGSVNLLGAMYLEGQVAWSIENTVWGRWK
jgi:hypothetical protein